VHWIEENHEVPNGKTKMECGDLCCTAEGGKFFRR